MHSRSSRGYRAASAADTSKSSPWALGPREASRWRGRRPALLLARMSPRSRWARFLIPARRSVRAGRTCTTIAGTSRRGIRRITAPTGWHSRARDSHSCAARINPASSSSVRPRTPVYRHGCAAGASASGSRRRSGRMTFAARARCGSKLSGCCRTYGEDPEPHDAGRDGGLQPRRV
jgi:hypothetical protein